MILNTPPPSPLRLGHDTQTRPPLLRRLNRLPHLRATIRIGERIQRANLVRRGAPIDAHVVAHGGEFDAIALDLGAGTAPPAVAGAVGWRVGGEPAVVSAFFERGGEVGEEGLGGVCGGEVEGFDREGGGE